jgi:hypothetical protein
MKFGIRLRWPWDHSTVDEHLEQVEAKDEKVAEIHAEAVRQVRENGFGPMLESIFVTHHPGAPRGRR